jgi:hypothetical protein
MFTLAADAIQRKPAVVETDFLRICDSVSCVRAQLAQEFSMLRSVHPGLFLGALAILSFGAGVLLEPMFERPAEATIPVRANMAAATMPVQPAAVIALPDEPAKPAAEEPASHAATDAPSIVEGTDGEQNVGYIEMKNMPAQEGQGLGDSGQDVNMIDEDLGGDGSASVSVPDPAPMDANQSDVTQN